MSISMSKQGIANFKLHDVEEKKANVDRFRVSALYT